MLLLTDEDFDERIARALRRASSHSVESARKHLPEGSLDSRVIDLAMDLGAILLTHDISTLAPLIRSRIRAGGLVPRVIVVIKETPVGRASSNILIIVDVAQPADWEAGVIYVPL